MNDFTSVRIHFTPDPVTCEGNSNEDIKGCLADVEKSLKRTFYVPLICWKQDSHHESRSDRDQNSQPLKTNRRFVRSYSINMDVGGFERAIQSNTDFSLFS